MEFKKIFESILNERVEILSGKMAQPVMARRYPKFTYSLSFGYLTKVPLDLVKGLDPTPETWQDDEGNGRDFEKGNPIPEDKPIELIWDFVGDDENDPQDYEFYMQNGNHRYNQAKINGDSHILALVQPKNKRLFIKTFA
jgi:hypothetical protein